MVGNDDDELAVTCEGRATVWCFRRRTLRGSSSNSTLPSRLLRRERFNFLVYCLVNRT